MFDAVQAKVAARSRVHGGPFRKYLLSGILRCGHCGSIMVGAGQGGGRTGRRFSYYKCQRARVSGTCSNYAVRTEVIEAAVPAGHRAGNPAGSQCPLRGGAAIDERHRDPRGREQHGQEVPDEQPACGQVPGTADELPVQHADQRELHQSLVSAGRIGACRNRISTTIRAA
jgi:hypothetical protein